MFSFSNAISLFVFCNGHAQESDGIYFPFSLSCIERNGVVLTPSLPLRSRTSIQINVSNDDLPQSNGHKILIKATNSNDIVPSHCHSSTQVQYTTSFTSPPPLYSGHFAFATGKEKREKEKCDTQTACACASVIMPPCHFIQVETVVHANACEVNVIC